MTSVYGKSKIICDPVHGFIDLPEDLFDTLIDTPLVQRLRDIRQLGLTDFVYPGARHSRFEHSLGAAYVMKTALHKITLNTRHHVLPLLPPETAAKLESILEELTKIRWEAVVAALLHDLGHTMLSHVVEIAASDTILASKPYHKMVSQADFPNHELLTLHALDLLIAHLESQGIKPTVNGIPLDIDLVRRILAESYLGTNGEETPKAPRDEAVKLASHLLSSDIDVDRADYILRDSKHTGAIEGLYGLERLYEVAAIVPYTRGARTRWVLGVIDKGIPVVENMLLSRVFMYNDVYLHPVSLVYDTMAARLLSLTYLLPPSVRDQCRIARCLATLYDRHHVLDEECLLALTDSGFNNLIQHVQRFISYSDTILDELGEIGVEVETGCKHLIALESLSRAILSRRHPPALVAEGRLAGVIASKMAEVDDTFVEKVRSKIDPLVTVSAALYYGYKPKKGREMGVFLRHAGFSVKLHEAEKAVLARSLANKVYARAVIIAPKKPVYRGIHAGWNMKPGSFEVETSRISSEILEACRERGLDNGDIDSLIVGSARSAGELAQELATIASQIRGD